MSIPLNPKADIRAAVLRAAQFGTAPCWHFFSTVDPDSYVLTREEAAAQRLGAMIATPRYSTLSEYVTPMPDGDDYYKTVAFAQRITAILRTTPAGVETGVMALEVEEGVKVIAERLMEMDADLRVEGFASPATLRYHWKSPTEANLIITLTPILRAHDAVCRQHVSATDFFTGKARHSWSGGLLPLEIDSWDYLDKLAPVPK